MMKLEIYDTGLLEILASKPFKFVKRSLVDKHIYDLSNFSIPLTTNLVSFKISGGAGRTVQVYNNNAVVAVLDNISEDEIFYISVERGINKIYVCDYIENNFKSNNLILTAYNVETFVWTYVKTLYEHRKQVLQSEQNLYIDDYKVEEYEVQYATELDALRDRFGNLFLIFRPEGWTKDQYRNFLKSFINAYVNYSLTLEGIKLISDVFSDVDPVILEYPQFIVCSCGSRLKLFSNTSLYSFSFWWGDAEVNLRNRWYLLTGASGELESTESGNETYVYVDSSEISGAEGRLVVKQSLTLPITTLTKEVKILGVIVSDGYKILEIYGSYRVDDGMVLWNKKDKSFGFEVYFSGNEPSDFEKEQIMEAMSRISSVHKRGYLFFERSGGEEEETDNWSNWMKRFSYFGEI